MGSYSVRGAQLDFSAGSTGFTQGLVRVTGLSNGGFAINWLADDADRSVFDGDLYGLVYRADLTATSAPHQLISDTGPTPSYPVNQATTALASGGFALISTDDAAYSAGQADSNRDVVVRFFDANGTLVGQPVNLGASSVLGVTITTLSDGRLVAGWTDTAGDVRAQYLTDTGIPIGGSFVVGNPPSDVAARPSFAAGENGGWVATYVSQTSAQASATFFDAAGTPSQETVVATNVTSILGLQVAGLADGGYVQVWGRTNGSGPVEVLAQIYTADGAKIGDPTTLSSTSSSVISVAALADGGFAIGFESFNSGTAEAKVYNSIGQQIGATIPIASALEPTVSALADGGFVLAWRESGSDQFHAQAYSVTASGDMVINGTGNADVLAGQEANDVLYGLASNDSLFGSVGNDAIFGGDGVDRVDGGRGNDYLDGGAGADQLYGGVGDDTFVVDDLGDQIFESQGGGFDKAYVLTSGYTLRAGSAVEILALGGADPTAPFNMSGNELVNNLWGNEGANALFGMAGNDALIGYGGSDYLDGGAGSDLLVGGAGDDTYVVDSATDTVVETSGAGLDKVYVLSDYFALSAGSEVEILALGGPNPTAPYNIVANELTNNLWGNEGNNALFGMAGNDALFGYGGNDYLDGGSGADLLVGGVGDDSYIIDNTGDVLVENPGEGVDRIYALTTYSLNANASIELIFAGGPDATAAINLTGNELSNNIYGNEGANALFGAAGNDFLFGNGGSDYLDGGTGADLMAGGLGDDTYVIDNLGDVVVENGSEGVDRAYALTSYTLNAGASVELIFAGGPDATAAINLTGNELSNNLYGNAGNNVLNGAGGNDLMLGGGGNDLFAFTTPLGPGNVDFLGDFEHGIDKIALDHSIFTALGTGDLGPNAFAPSTAVTAESRVIFNASTGAIFYDSDGSGAAGAIQFATVTSNLNITASDFIVI